MGMLHIYCGDGKGKTTAAVGLAVRAAGSGMRVHIVQLLKGGKTSELEALKRIPGITVNRSNKNYGFTFKMSERTMDQVKICHDRLLKDAEEKMKKGDVDMLIIDEFNAAYEYELLNRTLADRLVLEKPDHVEMILTGRNPMQKFLDIADYVSEIHMIKHPYTKGITARKGIEF